LTLEKQNECKKARRKVSKWNTDVIEFYQSLGPEIDTVEINCDFHF